MKHFKGDLVNVFQDPLTEKNLEGKAELLFRTAMPKQHFKKFDLVYWKVKFLSDGCEAYRKIKETEE